MFRSSVFRFASAGAATLTPNTDRRKIVRKCGLDPAAAKQNLIIIGCDEAGTGCLAGPLMAAAFCVLPSSAMTTPSSSSSPTAESPTEFEIADNIVDSKAVTAAYREKVFANIMKQQEQGTCISSITVAETDVIDGVRNITEVRLGYLSNAVRSVVEKVKQLPNFDSSAHMFAVVVDGQEMPKDMPLDFPLSVAIPRADSKYMCVAAASIIAKVTRDREMERLDAKYPGWGFKSHKGYGTKEHVQKCIDAEGKQGDEGLTPVHRASFTKHLKENQEIASRRKEEITKEKQQ